MNIKKFSDDFASIINSAIKDGVPIHEILLTVTTAKFDLEMAHFRARQQSAIREQAQKIVPASSIPPYKN